MLDRLHAERGGDVGLACSGAADEHDVVGLAHEPTAMELPHEGHVDLTAGKVAGQIAIDGKAGSLELIGHRPDLPLGHFGLQQLRQDRNGGLERGSSLFGEFGNGLRHALHLQASEHDDDGGACEDGGIHRRVDDPRRDKTVAS